MLLLAFIPAIAVSDGARAQTDVARDFGCSRALAVAADSQSYFQAKEGGFAVDLFAEITRRTGCQFHFVGVPLAGGAQALGDGEVDIVPLMSNTPKLERNARFISFMAPKFLLIVRQDFASKEMSLDEIVADERARVAVIGGQAFASYFDHRVRYLRANDRILEVGGASALVAALRSNQANAVIIASVAYQLLTNEMERQVTFRVVDTSHSGAVPVGICLSRATFNAQQVDNWYRVLEAMILDTTMLNLAEKYLPPRLANAVVRK